MPECPKCHITCGLWESGIICPACMQLISFEQAKVLEGYDPQEIYQAIELYELLGSLGMLRPGCNKVEFTEDGMILERMGELY